MNAAHTFADRIDPGSAADDTDYQDSAESPVVIRPTARGRGVATLRGRVARLAGTVAAHSRFTRPPQQPSHQRQSGQESTSTPAQWYHTLRRWSPGVIPPILGTLLLLAAGLLATHRIGTQPPPIDAHTLMVLFIVYLIGGTLYGLLLYLSTGPAVWWVVMAGGVAAYLIATFGVIGGPLVAALCGIILAAIAGRYGHLHKQPVADGTVVVTGFAGGYHRTLKPGMSVLVPGERVMTTFDTTEQRFTCPTQRASLHDGGETYVARAAATVAYNLVPSETHRAALLGERWETEIHDIVCTALENALAEWGEQTLAAGQSASDRGVARAMLQHLRQEARTRGVHIGWVSVRDIWLAPEGETLPVDEWDNEDDDEEVGHTPYAAMPHRALPGSVAAPALPPPRASERDPQITPAPATTTEPADASDASDASATLAPEVLSEAYESVREGRIHDPETIRAIAQAFLRVASDPDLNGAFPYDAMSAAQILVDRAKRLERSQRGAGRAFDGN